MIGKLVGNGWEAVLNDKCAWESANSRVAKWLNAKFPANKYAGPSWGTPGFAQLAEAAKATKAEVRDQKQPEPTPEGIVY